MSRQPLEWPSHGRAVDARNQAAEILNEIERQAAVMFDLAGNGKLIRDEALFRLGKVMRLANHGTRILEEQGAQTRPYTDLL